MASENANPQAPQAQVVTTSTTNNPARVGPYTDVSLTKRNVSQAAPALNVPPAQSPATTGGDTRPAYAEDQKSETKATDAAAANVGVQPPPHSPNSWEISTDGQGIPRSRDPYRNGGLDSYLNNE